MVEDEDTEEFLYWLSTLVQIKQALTEATHSIR